MKIIYDLERVPKFKNTVIAIGVFDGVHIAHRKILKYCVRLARRMHSMSLALTFWPHPQKQDSLHSLEHRLRSIKELGIDDCIVMNFSKKFSFLSPEDFVKKILSEKLHAKYVLVGKNFRFGKGGKGDTRLLKKLSHICGFKLKVFGVIKIYGKTVSSTLIRRLITGGDFSKARKLLGRPVSILGRVVKGDSLGKRLGFPTANIMPQHEVIPPDGIYAVKTILADKKFPAVCYIGTKPTFSRARKNKGPSPRHIEVHILDFEKNIYGKQLEIQFIRKIREDKRFDSSFSLAEQIKKDVMTAKSFF